jgi:hypothetical protein
MWCNRERECNSRVDKATAVHIEAHSLYSRIGVRLGLLDEGIDEDTTIPLFRTRGRTRLAVVRDGAGHVQTNRGDASFGGSPVWMEPGYTAEARATVEEPFAPPTLAHEPAAAAPSEPPVHTESMSPGQRRAVVAGVLAVAAALLAILFADREPDVDQSNARTRVPVTVAPSHTESETHEAAPHPAPAITATPRRKATEVQLSSDTGSVILHRANKPSLQVTVRELPDEQQPTRSSRASANTPQPPSVKLDELPRPSVELVFEPDIRVTLGVAQ